MSKHRTPLMERFWQRLDVGEPDECWLWKGSCTTAGYGHIGLGGREGKNVYAHRLAWETLVAPIENGQHVCHHCDVPRCCNPSHMFLGAHADNMADKAKKGRQPRGSKHHNAKLTEKDAEEAVASCASGVSQRAVAERLGVTRSCVAHIIQGNTWVKRV